MTRADDFDLGFRHRSRKSGDIEILHRGRLAATLRGRSAEKFKHRTEGLSGPEAQQLMARLTGSYKRGNERTAREHPRNRG